LVAQKLLAEMFGPAYMAEPDLWPLLALRCLTITLDEGRAPMSPVAFAGYGLLLAAMGRYDAAQRFGDLAMQMAEAPESRDLRPYRAQFSLCESTRQMVHNLMGRSADRFELAGETAYDERVAVPSAIERHDVTALTAYHLTRLALHLWFGDFEGGLPHAEQSE